MVRKALITGITGQDGAYLARFLIEKGYKVFGTFRRTSTPNFWRLNYLNVAEKIELIPMDLTDLSSIMEAINYSDPDEIYQLAAQSFVGRSFEEPLSTSDITGLGTLRVLEGARLLKTDAKIYQASTSELYGNDASKLKMKKRYSLQKVHMQPLNFTLIGFLKYTEKDTICLSLMEFYLIMSRPLEV